jgi:ABC-type uncharacterized transport system permease subunit
MTSIAYSSFINTGILTLLTNADLSHAPILGSVLPFLKMQYGDMGVDWYLTIGSSLTQTMMIAAVMPWFLLCSAVCTWKATQLYYDAAPAPPPTDVFEDGHDE